MTNESTNHLVSLAEMELLSLLMESDDEIYPWDTTTLTAEAYFSEVEQSATGNWLEQELIVTTPNYLSQLDRQWQSIAPAQSLQAKLSAQFAAQIPQDWLEAIARQASQVIHSQKSLRAQLVQCVRDLVPNCLEEDLLVLARPYAYAMRSNPSDAPTELTLGVEQWATLSEIQQAKLSLAIARYALEQIKSEENI